MEELHLAALLLSTGAKLPECSIFVFLVHGFVDLGSDHDNKGIGISIPYSTNTRYFNVMSTFCLLNIGDNSGVCVYRMGLAVGERRRIFFCSQMGGLH